VVYTKGFIHFSILVGTMVLPVNLPAQEVESQQQTDQPASGIEGSATKSLTELVPILETTSLSKDFESFERRIQV